MNFILNSLAIFMIIVLVATLPAIGVLEVLLTSMSLAILSIGLLSQTKKN